MIIDFDDRNDLAVGIGYHNFIRMKHFLLAEFLFPYRNMPGMQDVENQFFCNAGQNFSPVRMGEDNPVLYDEDVSGFFLGYNAIAYHERFAYTLLLSRVLR